MANAELSTRFGYLKVVVRIFLIFFLLGSVSATRLRKWQCTCAKIAPVEIPQTSVADVEGEGEVARYFDQFRIYPTFK